MIISLGWCLTMTKYLSLFLIILSTSLYAQDQEQESDFWSERSPSLKFHLGYPIVKIQDNQPKYFEDFLSIAGGAKMEFDFLLDHRLSIMVDSTYSPKRTNFSFERENREIDGNASLLTTFYSITYGYSFLIKEKYKYYLNFGPTVGVYTLDYTEIDSNETNISSTNRVRVRTHGFRVSLLREEVSRDYWEFSFVYTRPKRFTLINNSRNDAEAIEREDFNKDTETVVFIITRGWELF